MHRRFRRESVSATNNFLVVMGRRSLVFTLQTTQTLYLPETPPVACIPAFPPYLPAFPPYLPPRPTCLLPPSSLSPSLLRLFIPLLLFFLPTVFFFLCVCSGLLTLPASLPACRYLLRSFLRVSFSCSFPYYCSSFSCCLCDCLLALPVLNTFFPTCLPPLLS